MRRIVLASSLVLALSSVAFADDPPLRGTPELNIYKGYRDCTRPDTSHLDELAWIARPR